MNLKQIGNFGERIAEEYLRSKSYQILDRNYSSKSSKGPLRGEIDIVAQKSDIISFIEVKALRSPATLIAPEEKVDFRKQRKLIRAAESWLMKKKILLNSKWQIDVISVIITQGKAKIWYFENAIPHH